MRRKKSQIWKGSCGDESLSPQKVVWVIAIFFSRPSKSRGGFAFFWEIVYFEGNNNCYVTCQPFQSVRDWFPHGLRWVMRSVTLISQIFWRNCSFAKNLLKLIWLPVIAPRAEFEHNFIFYIWQRTFWAMLWTWEKKLRDKISIPVWTSFVLLCFSGLVVVLKRFGVLTPPHFPDYLPNMLSL